jgi:hypothetical protein
MIKTQQNSHRAYSTGKQEQTCPNILQIKDLSCGYGKVATLANVNFQVIEGEW